MYMNHRANRAALARWRVWRPSSHRAPRCCACVEERRRQPGGQSPPPAARSPSDFPGHSLPLCPLGHCFCASLPLSCPAPPSSHLRPHPHFSLPSLSPPPRRSLSRSSASHIRPSLALIDHASPLRMVRRSLRVNLKHPMLSVAGATMR